MPLSFAGCTSWTNPAKPSSAFADDAATCKLEAEQAAVASGQFDLDQDNASTACMRRKGWRLQERRSPRLARMVCVWCWQRGAACVMGRRRSRHAPSANHPASVRPGVVAPGGRANGSVKAASITERSTGSPDRGMSPTTRAAAWLERCLVRVRCADRPLAQRHAEHERRSGGSHE